MARKGDGIYLRGKTWWLDFMHHGKRHQVRLGRNINKTVARELAQVKRAAILKGEEGIGRKRKDLSFEKAAELFLEWAEANKRPHTFQCYTGWIESLKMSFGGKRLSQIHSLSDREAQGSKSQRRRAGCFEQGAGLSEESV